MIKDSIIYVQQRESLERKSQERQSRTVERRQPAPAPAPAQEVSQVQRQEQRQHRVEERQEVGYWISTIYQVSTVSYPAAGGQERHQEDPAGDAGDQAGEGEAGGRRHHPRQELQVSR